MKGRIGCKVIVIRGQMLQGFPYVHLVVGGGHDISTALSYTHTSWRGLRHSNTVKLGGKLCCFIIKVQTFGFSFRISFQCIFFCLNW